MAAIFLVLNGLLRAGDHVVSGKALFGSCRWILSTWAPRFGIETTGEPVPPPPLGGAIQQSGPVVAGAPPTAGSGVTVPGQQREQPRIAGAPPAAGQGGHGESLSPSGPGFGPSGVTPGSGSAGVPTPAKPKPPRSPVQMPALPGGFVRPVGRPVAN